MRPFSVVSDVKTFSFDRCGYDVFYTLQSEGNEALQRVEQQILAVVPIGRFVITTSPTCGRSCLS